MCSLPRTDLFRSVQIRSSAPSAAYAVGTPSGLRSRWRRRSLTDAAYPLRVRALRNTEHTLAVGRDHWARRCRNCQICTNLFVFTVRRCAERMGHAPSLQPQTKILCQAGVCPHRGTANKNPRGASPARVFAPNAQFSLRFGIEWHETAKGEFYGHL